MKESKCCVTEMRPEPIYLIFSLHLFIFFFISPKVDKGRAKELEPFDVSETACLHDPGLLYCSYTAHNKALVAFSYTILALHHFQQVKEKSNSVYQSVVVQT